MTMPIDLVLVRHGQSEQNLAMKHAKEGDTSLLTEEFRSRHVAAHRLTKLGQRQARLAGKWLKDNDMAQFDRRYASGYIRAQETAMLLGVSGPDWFVDPALREREWGDYDGLSWEEREEIAKDKLITRDTDSFFWIPPNGESIAQLTTRLRPLFDTLHRECSDKRVIIVCHGEVMWALRFILERMPIGRWIELETSDEPGVKINNCQILHYTRRNPKTGELDAYLNWMRSISPSNPSNNGPGWEAIVRKRFSDEELKNTVTKVKPLFGKSEGNV